MNDLLSDIERRHAERIMRLENDLKMWMKDNQRLRNALHRATVLLENGSTGGEITKEYCKQILTLIKKDLCIVSESKG